MIGKKILILYILSMISCSYYDYDKDKDGHRMPGLSESYQMLVDSKWVTTNIVSDECKYSINAYAFKKLYDSPDRIKLFLSLYHDARYFEGMAYALIALNSLEKKLYLTCKENYPEHSKVSVMTGDIIYDMNKDELIEDIECNCAIDQLLDLPLVMDKSEIYWFDYNIVGLLPDLNESYKLLVKSQIVTSNLVYDENNYSVYAHSFSELYESKENTKLFLKLFNEAENIEGKAYALIALSDLNEELYNYCKNNFPINKKIHVLWYDIESYWDGNKLFTEIESNLAIGCINHRPFSLDENKISWFN